ncbi:hypothetical protein RvY_15960 [Ramazzottius varieornatus]|uniref:Copper transport protein n=1 Tax=Ramazzottius varieornatus TaxID=947166 RepID=A0A1D1VXT6_RAMVA|nr:hypothetical protein RvY_15960 [Ramazzottius varieornatus]
MDMDMMPMYFHFDLPSHILFKTWSPQTTGEMVGAAIAVFCLAVTYEALKLGRQILHANEAKNKRRRTVSTESLPAAPADIPHGSVKHDLVSTLRAMFRWMHLLQTILHGIQFVIGYWLMLAAMTFSVWLFIGMVLGTMFGYFLFHWNPANDGYMNLQNDHCH